MQKTKAQQEMVGFVLIVVLVVVALMVFLVIAIRQDKTIQDDTEVKSILDSIMKYTTECSINKNSNYESVGDLFKSCYDNSKCVNLGIPSCDYLNETMIKIVDALLLSSATISAYQLDFLVKDDDGEQGIIRVFEGECNGTVAAAQKDNSYDQKHLIIRLTLCRD